MAETIDSIRSGKGMLPKNLHIYVFVVLAAVGLGVMFLNDKNEAVDDAEQQRAKEQAKVDALRQAPPDQAQIIKEGVSQAADAKPQEEPARPAQTPGARLEVPGLDPQRVIGNEAEQARHDEGTKLTSPILVLTGGDERPREETSRVDQELRRLTATRAPATPPGLSPEDRQLLDAATRAGAGGAPARDSTGNEDLSGPRQNEAFFQRERTAAEGQSQRTAIGLDPAISVHTIVQGTIIPSTIVSPINSDLPGNVIARTTQDVYDSVGGNHLLIPMGSSIYGVYNNAVIVGQERVAVVFNRIVFPNGSGVTLGAMSGTDQAGSAGVPGDVDNHFFQMFGSALLIAGLSALVSDSGGNTNVFVGGSSDSATDAAGQVLVDVSRSILQRNTRIQPTVNAPAGQRFNILVQRDLALRPYQGR